MIKSDLLKVAAKIKAGEVSARELVSQTIAQIHKSAEINAVLRLYDDGRFCDDGLFRDALSRAEAVDRGEITGALAGIPVIIKDNIDVAGYPSTCGSLAFKTRIATKNASVVQRLLSHGAIIVAKSNMDEFAMGSSNTTSAYGRVYNPLDLSRVPGGSSGGSAAAVASYQCFAALGTDTGGSIRQPASYCGIVGLKPTYGSVTGEGCFPLAPSMDQIGPLTRTVGDCAAVYGVICDMGLEGFTKIRPAVGRVAVIKEAITAAEEMDACAPQHSLAVGAGRVAESDIVGSAYQTDSDGLIRSGGLTRSGEAATTGGTGINGVRAGGVADALAKAAEHLRGNGCEVVEVSVPSFSLAHSIYKTLAFSEITMTMRAAVEGRELFGKEVVKRIMAGSFVLQNPKLLEAGYLLRQRLAEEMYAALEYADVLLLPTAPSAAFKFDDDVTKQEIEFSDIFTQPASIAGLPSLSVPFGFSGEGLPLGIQLVGGKFSEKRIFGIAKLLMDEE